MKSTTATPYSERTTATAERQREKGIAPYAHGLECNPADILTRLNSLVQELIDALMYCEWIKEKLGGRADG